MIAPHYPHKSISSIQALSAALGVDPKSIVDVAERVNMLHRRGPPQKKADGTFRETHDALPELKNIQKRINQRLLKRIRYPFYLQGALPNDKNTLRGPKANADIHRLSRFSVTEDIKQCYDYISASAVRRIWLDVFKFSHAVAELLTRLTTYQGRLPQGWRPSSYLANLALYEEEHVLVSWCWQHGFRYSRFLDDITVSNRNPVSLAKSTLIISKIHALVRHQGMQLKRTKHALSRSRKPIQVTGYNAGGHRTTLSKPSRRAVRAAVHQYIQASNIPNRDGAALEKQARSIRGRIEYVRQTDPKLAERLTNKMSAA